MEEKNVGGGGVSPLFHSQEGQEGRLMLMPQPGRAPAGIAVQEQKWKQLFKR